MEAFQLFRLIGTTEIKRVLCSQVEGYDIVYWEDIEYIFPGVKIQPYCIKHYPGVVLDVAPSITGGGDSIEFLMSTPSLSLTDDGRTGASTSTLISPSPTESVADDLQVVPSPIGASDDAFGDDTSIISSFGTPLQDLQGGDNAVSRTTLSFKQVAMLARRKELESKIEQRLVSPFSPEVQTQIQSPNGYNSMVQEIKEVIKEKSEQLMGCLQKLEVSTTKNKELMTQMIEMQEALDTKQDEMKQLQIQALSQLALLQKQ
ncbi:hypothetical protein BGZ65_005161, partial [Modicella reniformis]